MQVLLCYFGGRRKEQEGAGEGEGVSQRPKALHLYSEGAPGPGQSLRESLQGLQFEDTNDMEAD